MLMQQDVVITTLLHTEAYNMLCCNKCEHVAVLIKLCLPSPIF